jgi:chromosome segregation ATPase
MENKKPFTARIFEAQQAVSSSERDIRIAKQKIADLEPQKALADHEAAGTVPPPHDDLKERLEKVVGEIAVKSAELAKVEDRKSEKHFSLSTALGNLRRQEADLRDQQLGRVNHIRQASPLQDSLLRASAKERSNKIAKEISALQRDLRHFESELVEKQEALKAVQREMEADPLWASWQKECAKLVSKFEAYQPKITEEGDKLRELLRRFEALAEEEEAYITSLIPKFSELGIADLIPLPKVRRAYFDTRERALRSLDRSVGVA